MKPHFSTTVTLDPQALALEFRVEDWVTPIGSDRTDIGRVVAVWPGLGVLDVEWATGQRRMNVEDIIRIDRDGHVHPPGFAENVPGGLPVRPGREASRSPDPIRIARAFIKESLYWAAKDRGYRATQGECDEKTYTCPKCRDSESPMRRSIYKREDGKSIKLMACPNCLFLIRINDVHGHHDNVVEDVEVETGPELPVETGGLV